MGFRIRTLLQDAIIRCVEVVGEAARHVSEHTRQLDLQVPWTMIAGMRNVLAHDYGGVNLDQVYGVVTKHLPDLIRRMEALIERLEGEVAPAGGGPGMNRCPLTYEPLQPDEVVYSRRGLQRLARTHTALEDRMRSIRTCLRTRT